MAKLTIAQSRELGIKDYTKRRSFMVAKYPKMSEKQITNELILERKRLEVAHSLNIILPTYFQKTQQNPIYLELEKSNQFEQIRELLHQEIEAKKLEKEEYRQQNPSLAYFLGKAKFKREHFNQIKYQNLQIQSLMKAKKHQEAFELAFELYKKKQRLRKQRSLKKNVKKKEFVVSKLVREFEISKQTIYVRLKGFNLSLGQDLAREYLVSTFLERRKQAIGSKNKLTAWTNFIQIEVDELINLAVSDKSLVIYKLISTTFPNEENFKIYENFVCN